MTRNHWKQKQGVGMVKETKEITKMKKDSQNSAYLETMPMGF